MRGSIFAIRLFLIGCCFLLSANTVRLAAQRQVCGFDKFHQLRLNNPRAALQIQSANSRIGKVQRSLETIRKSTQKRDVIPVPGGGNLYQIPVVVHIMHRPGDPIGSVNNPSNATIEEMIAFLNRVYEGTNISVGGVSTPLRFVLAKRTPDCQPTNGINRVAVNNTEYINNGLQDGNSGPGMPEANLKAMSRWSVNEYYNIWIVHYLYNSDPGVITNGYAYFPGNGDLDGTVLIGEVANGTAQTLPHEIGHALALEHTFNGGDDGITCPVNTGDCTVDGDKVCDTDPHVKRYDCPAPGDINVCTGNSWGLLPKNIMGYFDCRDRFSPGQGSRMEATMLTERYSLVSSLGGTAPTGTTVAAINHATTISNPDNFNSMGPVKVVLNTLFYQSEGYDGSAKVAYEDKTCTMGTILNSTQSYTINVSTRLNDQVVKVWLDLDNNGTYSANELLGTSTASATSGEYIHSITLPANTLNNAGTVFNWPLRMRVAADFVSNPDFTYDSELDYGQMEDFAVTINNSSLPVNFGSISAFIKNGRLNLNWRSETEKNNDAFIIQLSGDGQVFHTVGTVASLAAGGNSDKPIDYRFSIGLAQVTGFMGGLLVMLLSTVAYNGDARKKNRMILCMVTFFIFLLCYSCNKKADALSGDQQSLFLRIAQV
ncbi:MAG TPA: M43 family zinc metalloprotease, partial [Niabella sp.]|nr:M43 family zinc metalloprotease [Niabella sp.]